MKKSELKILIKECINEIISIKKENKLSRLVRLGTVKINGKIWHNKSGVLGDGLVYVKPKKYKNDLDRLLKWASVENIEVVDPSHPDYKKEIDKRKRFGNYYEFLPATEKEFNDYRDNWGDWVDSQKNKKNLR